VGLFRRLPLAGLRRPYYRIHYLIDPEAIVECGSPRLYGLIIGYRVEEVIYFMDECVFPSDHVSMRPPFIIEWVYALGHQYVLKPSPIQWILIRVDLELVKSLEVEDYRSFGSVDLNPFIVLPPSAESRCLDAPDDPVLELH